MSKENNSGGTASTKISKRHPQGFIVGPRGTAWEELLRANRNAFVLLYVIAQRAQRQSKFNRYKLKPGEALLGDFENYGMSEREYRTAKTTLKKFGLATFETTVKGTIATITGTEVFDPNIDDGGGQNDGKATDPRRTPDDYQKGLEAKNAEGNFEDERRECDEGERAKVKIFE